MSKWLDEDGLRVFWELVKNQIKDAKITTTKTTNEWINNPEYVPEKGEMVVYSDYKTILENNGQTTNIPYIKIGDGVSPVNKLPFADNTPEKLNHSLTIGDKVYDGSADVVVSVYEGKVE